MNTIYEQGHKLALLNEAIEAQEWVDDMAGEGLDGQDIARAMKTISRLASIIFELLEGN